MSRSMLYLSRQDVERTALTMAEVIEAVEEAFREKAQGRVEVPPKVGVHTQPDSILHAMPAWIPAAKAAGMKWVGGYKTNLDKGLPFVNGLMILNDGETGIPIAVMDATWVTAKRTAAGSALAARYLAREDARVLGISGCGVQGRSHVEALVAVRPGISRVLAYDVSPQAQDRFVEEMQESFPKLDFQKVSSVQEAVQEADLVVTAGPVRRGAPPTILAGWLRPGAFATAVDFDSYWAPEAFEEADLFFTDDLETLEYSQSKGFFKSVKKVHGELGQLVAGEHPGRTSPEQRTMAMLMGLAIVDVLTAARVLDRARQMGIGTELPL